ncbi:Uncharacterised protein [Mycobacterium tuberculosis]|nr:Uncharacterised protein [Mycobacterium tuberculosis]SGB71073.1 Uncharacterised protein [Mycobacterium tuberculosis]SGG63547.1 Uncharacterised protein [Mycobacterium tuberculosis]SGL82819.1 Uncharacterised protein [Mycobacterium tuberculosis]SHA81016.1 Uncharacterised protein [Mycobacterium tuberculosis]
MPGRFIQMVSVHAGEGVVFSRSGRGTCRLNPCCVQIVYN